MLVGHQDRFHTNNLVLGCHPTQAHIIVAKQMGIVMF
jgi:hypothetical protein